MAKKTPENVTEDFATLIDYLKSTGVMPAVPSPQMLSVTKRVHSASYSLILWRFRLSGLPDHSRPFVEEIASDALQILPQALMGYTKTTQLLTRGIVENCFRHLYFSHHPIEFAIMNGSGKWYLKWEDLTDYAASHPYLKATRPLTPVDKLKNLYSDLSGGVHGRRVQDLETRVALDGIKYDERSMTGRVKELEKAAESVNFLLAAFHCAKFRKFERVDRKVILATMPQRARQILSNLPA